MLNKVKALALEKFAGNEELATEFVNGFTKQAMAVGKAPVDNKFLESLNSGIGGSLGKSVGGLLISGGVAGMGLLVKSMKNNNLHSNFLVSLEKVLSSNVVLKDSIREKATNKDKIIQYANTVFKFAPNVATDHNLLSSILANAVHGEGIDPMTIKTLTELEGRYSENTSFSPKTYI